MRSWCFARDAALSGQLAWLEVHKDGSRRCVDGLDGASSVRVSPDGQHVYVTGTDDDAVAVFTRETTAPTRRTSASSPSSRS